MKAALRRLTISGTGVVLWLALAPALDAQVPKGVKAKATAPPAEQPTDPLGRTTPRGTMAAFIEAGGEDDLASATFYLQVNASQREGAKKLVRDLTVLLDRYLTQPLTSISDSPDGVPDDGLPVDRERIGPLNIDGRETDLTLVRVTDPQAGRIWLISSETLAEVPGLMSSVPRTLIERLMPPSLVEREVLGISLAHWIVLAATLLIPVIALALLAAGLIFLVKRIASNLARRWDLDSWYTGIRWPAIILLTVAIQMGAIRLLGFPLTFRITYGRIALIVVVVASTWLIRRLLTLAFSHARGMVDGKNRARKSLMLLAERVLKAVVVLVAVFAFLTILGVDTKTTLAGLGIGGVALALGAQKTVENFLGGFFLLTDKALAVGDMCNVGNHFGQVEDITLRSVRLRTLDRTLVSIPAGSLAQAGIENFATREKFLVKTTLRLRYGTTVKQLKQIVDGIRRKLDEDERLEAGTSRIRLVNFGERAVELELFAYVLTPNVSEFFAVREALLLEIATIVEASGSGFAQPTEFVYVGDKPTVDAPAWPTARAIR